VRPEPHWGFFFLNLAGYVLRYFICTQGYTPYNEKTLNLPFLWNWATRLDCAVNTPSIARLCHSQVYTGWSYLHIFHSPILLLCIAIRKQHNSATGGQYQEHIINHRWRCPVSGIEPDGIYFCTGKCYWQPISLIFPRRRLLFLYFPYCKILSGTSCNHGPIFCCWTVAFFIFHVYLPTACYTYSLPAETQHPLLRQRCLLSITPFESHNINQYIYRAGLISTFNQISITISSFS
jgi:hypothetical protein